MRRAVAVVFCGTLWLGCASSPLPPKLSPAQLEVVDGVDLPYRVAVEPHEVDLYSRLLLEDLRAAEVFAHVGMLGSIDDAQLIARVVRPVANDHVAVLPIFSILTLGVVPSWFSLEYGASFELVVASRNADCAADSVAVDASYEGTLVMGWMSSLLNISPRRTVRDVRGTERYRRSMAHAIARRADAIHRLVAGNC